MFEMEASKGVHGTAQILSNASKTISLEQKIPLSEEEAYEIIGDPLLMGAIFGVYEKWREKKKNRFNEHGTLAKITSGMVATQNVAPSSSEVGTQLTVHR